MRQHWVDTPGKGERRERMGHETLKGRTGDLQVLEEEGNVRGREIPAGHLRNDGTQRAPA